MFRYYGKFQLTYQCLSFMCLYVPTPIFCIMEVAGIDLIGLIVYLEPATSGRTWRSFLKECTIQETSNSSTTSVFASYPIHYLQCFWALMSVGIEAFQFIEFFAGSRMATQCVAGAGYRATCIDIDDHANAGYAIGEGSVFDILSPSGLVFPYCIMIISTSSWSVKQVHPITM